MSGSRWLAWLVVVALLTASGCGQEEERAATPSASGTTPKLRDCRPIAQDPGRDLLLCRERRRDGHGAFAVDDPGGRRVLPIEPPGATATASDAGRVGHWEWAALSPDGSMLLAQWSAECEIPIAFFVPAEGGEPRVVTGEEDWATSPTSLALGWTTDGRAIVLFPEANPCGVVGAPGLYLVGVDGTHERVRGLDRFATKLLRSLQPRSAESLEAR
jgi:hypothetical protein